MRGKITHGMSGGSLFLTTDYRLRSTDHQFFFLANGG